MRELKKISEELFDKIRTRFDHVNLGDENAKSTTDPQTARFFNFNYVSKSGENFGNITVSLVDETSLKVYFSSNITEKLTDEQENEWFEFLRSLKKFAKRNMLMFDVRDINRSNLDLRDLKQQSKADSTFTKDELAIAESRLYGIGNNRRVSFGDVGSHRLIIKHKDQINPETHGSRSRQIEHIFIETPVGERFLLDHTNLGGARAMANHLQHGGRIDDQGASVIDEMVKEMASMRHFVRSMRNRTFEDAETTGMVESAVRRYNEVKDNLKKLQGRKGHDLLMSMCNNSAEDSPEVDVDALRERFVKKIYDDRFNDALPYVYRAYQTHKKTDTSVGKEFESWAHEVTEATWDRDSDDVDENELIRIMEKPLLVGIDGVDARAALRPLIDSEELSKALRLLAHSQGPDADARRVTIGWLATNGEHALADRLLGMMKRENSNPEPQPVSPEPKKQPTGKSTTDEPVVSEEVETIKRLSGI